MIWARPQDIGREVIVLGKWRGQIVAVGERHGERRVIVKCPDVGREEIEDYFLEWASPREDDLDWRSIPEAVKHFKFREELERTSREISEQRRREERWNLWRERVSAAVGMSVYFVLMGLLCLVALALLLGCLIFAFLTGGGRPPWAP